MSEPSISTSLPFHQTWPRRLEGLFREHSGNKARRLVAQSTLVPKITLADLKIRVIDPKTGVASLVPLEPNAVQVQYLDLLTAKYSPFDWRRHNYTLHGIREDCIKSRQQGMSTLWLALYFLDTYNAPNIESHVYAHDGATTRKLFWIVHRYYKHLDENKKRPLRRSNQYELVFDDTDSGFFVGMVGGGSLGRGGTVSNVHISERAWSERYPELELGLFPSVPVLGNITRETTTNGLNEYYQERQRVNRGETVFTPRFFGWNLTPHYRATPPTDFRSTDEETKLVADHGLDEAQLQWRREGIKTYRERFPQEFPLTEEEAFISSGHSYFNRSVLMAMLRTVQQPEYTPLPWTGRGALKLPRDMEDTRRLVADQRPDTYLRVWEIPQAGKRYIVAADTAQGITASKDSDYCDAVVLDAQAIEIVATLHGRFEPFMFACLLYELGWYYSYHTRERDEPALLGVERENHGHAVNGFLQHHPDLKYPLQVGKNCTGLYLHDPVNLTGRPRRNQGAQGTLQVGWPSTSAKSDADDTLVKYISDAEEVGAGVWINDRDTIGECLTYVHLPGGGAGGEAGSHDDRVRSLAIACALHSLCYERPIAGAANRPQPGVGYRGPHYGNARGESKY